MSQTYYFYYVVVLYSCQNGNLLANLPQHGIIHPAVTHNSGFANELYNHLQKSKRDNVVKTIKDIRSTIYVSRIVDMAAYENVFLLLAHHTSLLPSKQTQRLLYPRL